MTSFKIMVVLTCLLFNFVFSLRIRGQKKLQLRSDWSPLGVKFKISDEHLCHFYMGVPSGKMGVLCPRLQFMTTVCRVVAGYY